MLLYVTYLYTIIHWIHFICYFYSNLFMTFENFKSLLQKEGNNFAFLGEKLLNFTVMPKVLFVCFYLFYFFSYATMHGTNNKIFILNNLFSLTRKLSTLKWNYFLFWSKLFNFYWKSRSNLWSHDICFPSYSVRSSFSSYYELLVFLYCAYFSLY